MAVQFDVPGVYIQEFAPGAPIQGVGTSTAAFLGPSHSGPMNEPIKVTSWDRFIEIFGNEPLDGFYLWYAVRGFFFNQGRVCYIVRVSNATFDELILNDQSGQPTIRLFAREPGISVPQITVEVVDDIHLVDPAAARLFRPTASISNANADGTSVNVDNADDAILFRAGDAIVLEDGGTSEDATVRRIEGTVIRLAAALRNTFNAGTVRLSSLEPDDTIFRAEEAAGLSSGSVIRLSQDATQETVVVRSVTAERIRPDLTTYRVELSQGITQDFDLSASVSDVTIESFEFSLIVERNGVPTTYGQLGMHPAHRNYFRRVINEDANGLLFSEPVEPPNTASPPDNRPATAAAQPLAGGTNDDPASLFPSDYRHALAQLERIDDVNMVAVPDRTDADVQQAVIAHCRKMHDRFAILDSRRGAPPFGTNSVELQRPELEDFLGFAALYYPWLWVSPASGNDPVLAPPSGHIAGIYARTDNNRGVHKAPAGNEALINGALGVERILSNEEHGQLNLPLNVNVIRVFKPGGRPVVWGGRTTTENTNWQYVNIRRLFLFLEESIEEGIRWAVFEPNNLQLWQKLKRTITEFLTRVWRDGALFGATAEEAFYVRIDEVLNPVSEQALGRLYIEIGVRPSYPAEFIIVRIGIWQGGSDVSES